MSASRIDHLTEAQRACLRLVLTHHNSKEIAVIFGVSPSAIDKRIERAVQVLGVGTRFEAARLLQQHEGMPPHREERAPSPSAEPTGSASPSDRSPTTYERLPSEPIDVSRSPSAPPQIDQTEPWGLVRRFMGLTPGSGLEGTARNRLSIGDRLIRLIGLMALLAVTTVALVTMTMTLTSLFRQNRTGAVSSSSAERSARTGGRIEMLKERRQATDTVTVDFLKAEAAVDQAAQLAASCVATLLQQRAAANLPVATGLAALQLVAEASSDIIRARQRFVDAHRALVSVRSEIGLGAFYGYGDEGECPPNEGALRPEAPVRLVAVA